MRENWVFVEGFDDYMISSYGRVQSKHSDRDLKYTYNQRGIPTVGLQNRGVYHRRSIAKLVAQHFLPSSEKDQDTIIYLDGNPGNVNVENLRWGTRQEAIRYHKEVRHHA